MIFNTQDLLNFPDRYRAHFINSLSGYKSANLVGTRSPNGEENLSIVSSVFHLGAHPPLMGVIFRPHSVRRDTLENILQTKTYTINHVNSLIWKEAHQTSARYDEHQSEFDATGLTPYYHDNFGAPFVAQSQLKIGLELCQHQTIELNKTVLVIGKIVHVEVDDNAVAEDGFINLEQLDTIAVSGLDCYHTTSKIARLEYAKPNKPATTKA
ncbi:MULTISPECIES: flavin reductase family protein [Pseudoalteromonas]|uniref:Flavin reductase n=1 Tax=Pseudoalteromonas obscura TaxID=3048491 RepID=A0ABT7EQI7_9GAMM|nr:MULTISPECIES: flavin reductase [Pseudoalteromonas]MBQ4835020.1 flavin reductase [Pseudoalteromonas luteoviolacea]MDK2597314.1 flavin reductase [Pseudoalteromonas sp. P94(2023)]